MRLQMTNGLRGESFAIRVVNGWNKLPQEVVEARSVYEFKKRPDDVRLSVFKEDTMLIVGLRRWPRGGRNESRG